MNLVHGGQGKLFDNKLAATAIPGSFLLKVKDVEGRGCELGLLLDEDGVWRILVHHAFRRIKR